MPTQLGLFGALGPDDEPMPDVAPAVHGDGVGALAARLPAGLRLGTSSWNFPGWRGLVYAPGAAKKHLSRFGLAAYARHPLFRTVGLDRAFYAPLTATEYAEHAAMVPPSFRFLVKAWEELTSPTVRGKDGPNRRYLDADQAIDLVLAPAVEGLGDRRGPLVFQFPPQGAAVTKEPQRFADRLHGFLAALPPGTDAFVELRDAALLTGHYGEALAATATGHCFCVHPRLPPLARQLEVAGLPPAGRGVAVRWMLHAGLAYEAAKARYEPFDRLVDPDPGSRGAVAALIRRALADLDEVTVVVNNKAEGSAPLSVIALAQDLAAADPPTSG
ncbi:MAG: DUF72 domain-containing protein [Planctomycetota bacterium]